MTDEPSPCTSSPFEQIRRVKDDSIDVSGRWMR